jgi:hypothetical protein
MGFGLDSIGDFLSGTAGFGSTTSEAGLLSPEQSDILKKLLPMLYGGASGESNPALENMLSASRASAENNWTQNTKPQILESAGNLHSSYTGNKIGQEYSNMQQGLNTNESTMRYQNRMDQLKSLLAALGISTKENIVDKPGTAEGILGGIGSIWG